MKTENHFACIKKNGAENKEKALAAYWKQFKGGCNKCGKYRHKSAHCSDNGESKFHLKKASFTTNLRLACHWVVVD